MELLNYFFISASTLVLAVILVIVSIWRKLSKPVPRPILIKEYWGPGNPKDDDHTILPFKIDVSNEELNDLQQRLRNVRKLTPPLEDNFRYGFNTEYLQKVATFWLKEYDWRLREKYLNSLPQFTTQVGGLQLHFIHAKPRDVPAGVRVLPLLLLHGWPGSVREFYELIPLLTAARPGAGFVFEVVAPSLPGFGFSEGAAKPGLGPAQMGVLFRVLMQRLGHFTFYVHGSDWGHVIGASLATLFPESVLGFHTNMVYSSSMLTRFKMMLGSIYPKFVVDSEHCSKVYPMRKHMAELLQETGYFHLHATKPDTIGVALQDSPIGLAAYILEKFSTWTNNEWRELSDGGLEKKYTLTNLLDNVMIYWITGAITTSVRLYSEAFSKKNPTAKLDRFPCVVPTAVSNFPKELVYVPEMLARDKFPNLVQFTHLPRGGHFPAFEEPQILADDMWDAFEQIERYITESLDGVFWNLMPNTSESAKILAQNCTSRMKGDPSYTIAVGDFGADLDEYGFSNDVGTLKEEDRLSATVEMITDEAAVVPRGALFKIDEETMVENPTFRGLAEDEAKLLYNYYHYRWPREKWRTRFFETSEYDLDLDFLDSIDKDIPEGTWSVKIETHFLEPIAIVRNLQWPGMTCFHCIKTPFHGFFYVGDGRKNMDMPFMINLKTPEEE